ncbi:MAG: class I SAM-dependent methyltransferase [Candidatus Kaiserbacteria bacterium]|nr:class I SAM-dependent methyltransferase [Candidatus Kaiserbacteria bacterium]
MPPKDRFKKISNNYGELFSEVFAVQGFNYEELEKSIFDTVSRIEPDLIGSSILDIGVGDGISIKPFVCIGCKKLIGIDLNQEMIDSTRTKFGDSISLFKMNATDMTRFKEGEFEIIISGATVHNIPKTERVKFWKEILRLKPKIFITADKIKDSDTTKHHLDYQSEIEAIKKIYGERHSLKEAKEEWLDHYKCDEKEALDINEISNNLGEKYKISTVFEMGLYKTIIALRK